MCSILKLGNATMIFNGGNALEGCPKSWEEAYKIEDKLNNGLTREEREEEKGFFWQFDCGFKLDFDGELISIESRFYPPKTHYGAKWDGLLSINLLDEEIKSKSFECDTLEQLKKEVENYVNTFIDTVRRLLLIT